MKKLTLMTVLAAAALAALVAVQVAGASHTKNATKAPTSSSCHLGNGIQHVVSIVFDNVHFFRDNPNVPSDLEQMPHLLNFLEQNGTVFSNSHTPMIAHTADDSLTIYTGLYGDRHGQPLTNSYNTYNPDGTTDPATSFAYWTSPVADTSKTPNAGHDTTPTMSYSPTVPATGPADKITPAPWVPFTRAGCSVGDFSTANMVLENTNPDLSTVFGPNSPEVAAVQRRPGQLQGRRGSRLHRCRTSLREGRRDLCGRAGEPGQRDDAIADRDARSAADRTGRLHRLTRACSARATLRLSSGPARRTSCTTATR